MEGTKMETKSGCLVTDAISSLGVEVKKVQGPEVSSTSLYIRRNSSLNQLLTKGFLKPLELPTSPLDKKNLQDRWTACPSPLPMPPIGSLDENGQSHHKDMPIRMKSLPSFGFKIGKLAESSLSCRKKRPSVMGLGSPLRCKVVTGGRGSPVIKIRQRRRRTASPKKTKIGLKGPQSSLSSWVTKPDGGGGANSAVGGAQVGVHLSKSMQDQRRAIMSTAYSVMQEENIRNRQALHKILNIVNRELIQKNEGYRMLLKLQPELLRSETAVDMVQLLTEAVVDDGESGTFVECDKYEKRDQSTS